MIELLVATKNQGKLKEIRELLKNIPLRVTSLADYPQLPDVVEDGKTFRANAIKKAVTIARLTGKLVLGEDSGLEVEVLNNAPGVSSARYASENSGNAIDSQNNAKLLRALRGYLSQERKARYRCLAALANKEGVIRIFEGRCQGLIAQKPAGKNGFGYDPLFLVPAYRQTFGQLDPAIKSCISHRARALDKIKKFLKKLESVGLV